MLGREDFTTLLLAFPALSAYFSILSHPKNGDV